MTNKNKYNIIQISKRKQIEMEMIPLEIDIENIHTKVKEVIPLGMDMNFSNVKYKSESGDS